MEFQGPVEDRLAIRERLDAYGGAVMRKDYDAWIACWADDAEWIIRGRTILGKDRIGQAWREAMSAYQFVGFYASAASMTVTGDEASLEAHTLEFLVPHAEPERRQHGLYRDHLVRRSGRWLFRSRSFEIVHPPIPSSTGSPS
jgi:uncharacterized protein (TIGR02246 family)